MTVLKRLFCALVLLSLFLSSEYASGQVFRRQLQRFSGLVQQQNPGYHVAPPSDRPLLQEPLVQGDGRLLERVQNLVGGFTGQGTSELKPVAVISLASFEEYKRVLQTVAQKIRLDAGSGEEPALLNAFLNVYGTIVGRGFDTHQPMGLLLMTDGLLYYPLLFTPLSLESKLGQSMLNDYAELLPDGRYVLRREKIHWAFGQLYVQQKNGWVFIAAEKMLDTLPEDPTVLLQGMNRRHLLAAKFELHNLPVLPTRAALTLGEMSTVAQAESEFDKASARLSFAYLRSLAEQTDVLEHTLSYDDENNDYVLKQTESVKPNTERAVYMQQRREAASIFGGFYRPERAVAASHLVMDLTSVQRKELETLLDETIGKHLLTEEERRHQKEHQKDGRKPTENTVTRNSLLPESEDPRDKLAALLAAVPPEDFEQSAVQEQITETQQDFFLSPVPQGTSQDTLDEPKKLQIVLRRIGAAYYWALITAVRSGHFDGASTWSAERGLIGAFRLTGGEHFGDSFNAAFDAIFAEVQEKFPDFYAKNIEKDFAESYGFRLTGINFNVGVLLEKTITNPFLKSIIPAEWSQRNLRLILAVRNDALCYAVGEGAQADQQIAEALSRTEQARRVDDVFFVYSAYELGQAFAASGDPERFVRLKALAASADPKARAYAVTDFTDTTKTVTLRISALLTPSFWRLFHL